MTTHIKYLGASALAAACLFLAPSVHAAGGTFGGGAGTAQSPYLIEDCEDLQAMEDGVTLHYALTDDIDCAATQGDPGTWGAEGFDPIMNFSGNLDGNGYAIDGLYLAPSSEEFVGLFGTVNEGSINDLGLTNVEIDAVDSQHVGPLVGFFWSGTISKVYATGTVSTDGAGDVEDNAGGLIGLFLSGTISNAYAIVDIIAASDADSTTEFAGGLIGKVVTGTISNVYAAGELTAPVSGGADPAQLGGLIGTGTNATVTNSFWDTETTGQATSADTEVGKTTAQMTTTSTFTDAGWNFTNTWDRDNGTNGNYPYLIFIAAARRGSSYVAPVVSTALVLSPNGGETLMAGTSSVIRYQTRGLISLVNIQASYDNGATWETVAGKIPSADTFVWTPKRAAEQALVRVQVTDLVTVVVEDQSDASFKIAAAPEAPVTVVPTPSVPDGNAAWPARRITARWNRSPKWLPVRTCAPQTTIRCTMWTRTSSATRSTT